MGPYCQTPPVVSSAVQPNIMLSLDVSGSMTWCGYYANAGESTPCDSNCTCSVSALPCATSADCTGGTDVCGSCGYNATVTYDGYFNPNKSYMKDTNGIWEEYTASGTCKVVPTAAKCESSSTYNSSCTLKGGSYGSGAANSAGTSPAACTVITSGSNPCKSPNYCCATATAQTGTCGSSSGNFLNYINMHRIDMLRWAMTGGSPSTCSGSNLYSSAFCDPELWSQAGNNTSGKVGTVCGNSNLVNGDGVTQSGCVLLTDNGTKIKVPWRRINGSCSVNSLTNTDPVSCATAGGTWTPAGGLAFTFETLPVIPRMGFLAFDNHGTVDGIYMGDFTATGTDSTDVASTSIKFPYMNLISHVNSIPPQNGTPTGPAMWDVFNYFAQQTPKFTDTSAKVSAFSANGLKPQSGTSTSWKNPMFICPNGTNCVYTPCGGNYVILMSDGQWNSSGTGTTCTIGSSTSCAYSSEVSADPVVPSYCMHNNFLNAQSNYQTKVNSVYTISLFGGGTGLLSLENVAMYGSFNNSGGKVWPSNLTGFPAGTCTSMTDCTTSPYKGSGCTPLPPSSADWDQNGDGVPDTSYTASTAGQIKSGILTAVQDILQRSTSGTAVSILASGEGSGANLLQAFFYPQKAFIDADIAWTGEMQNLWYYIDPQLKVSTIREDTNSDYQLELTQDNVVHFRFDTTQNKTVADLYQDTTGTGVPLTFQSTVALEQTKNLWEAGTLLWARNLTASPRTIYTSINGTSLTGFNTGNATTLQAALQAGSKNEATNLISYVNGNDVQYCAVNMNTCASNSDCTGGADICTSYRPRTAMLYSTGPYANKDYVWKLGDIISSTPKIQSWVPLNSYASDPPVGYDDITYNQYISSLNYKTRGTVYTGANDGMLHAFTLGLVGLSVNSDVISKSTDKFLIAQLCTDANGDGRCNAGENTGIGLGTEMWAYVPQNTLPYLRYMADPAYCHLYYVDGTPYIFDASINAPSSCSGDYSLCARQTKCLGAPQGVCSDNPNLHPSQNNLDLANTSWRTILIGSMGQGGSCRQNTGSCSVSVCSQHSATTCTKNSDCPGSGTTGETCLPACVVAPSSSSGYSSYFALDITNPQSPALLWEFSDPGLGFATAGPAVVRVNGGAPASKTNGILAVSNNGKWYVILASGPTGPIDPASLQFLASSDQTLKIYVIDLKTGTLVGGKPIDTKLQNAFAGSIVNAPIDTDKWNPGLPGSYEDNVLYIPYTQLSSGNWVGGVLRLTTGGNSGEDSNPGNWNLSTLITVPGAVTTSVSHLQDRTNHRLWLYFGTGRYFYKIGSTIDDANTQQYIYGIKEPCYDTTHDLLNMGCTTSVSTSSLTDATTNPPATEPAAGWFISLDPSSSSYSAERIITNPLGAYTGAVFFPSFEPSTAACGFSGNSFLWAVNYNTGGSATPSALQGMALIQVSTGQIQEVTLSSALTDKVPGGSTQGRRTTGFTGAPPKGQGLSVVINPRPMQKVLHMQEK